MGDQFECTESKIHSEMEFYHLIITHQLLRDSLERLRNGNSKSPIRPFVSPILQCILYGIRVNRAGICLIIRAETSDIRIIRESMHGIYTQQWFGSFTFIRKGQCCEACTR